MESFRRPGGRRVLLPAEVELCETVGITEDEYLSFVKLYYQAYQYVESRQNGITITEKKLIEQTRNKLEDNLKKFNHFFENEWVQYKILLESVKLSKFKETETIKLK